MTWIRKTPAPTGHHCATPMRERVTTLPPARYVGASDEPRTHREHAPDGVPGDLWRCDDCRRLWRIGDACDSCDRHNLNGHHGNLRHMPIAAWRPARWWQRVRYRR